MTDDNIMIDCVEEDCSFFHVGNWGDKELVEHQKMEEEKRKYYRGFKRVEYWDSGLKD